MLQGNGVDAISNYLKTNLIPSLTTVRVANIYDYEITDLGGFPSVTITASELQGKAIDNTRHERVFRFMIRIFIDRNVQNFGNSKAETILRTVADEVVTKLDADYTLGNNCIYIKPITVKYGYINRESNNIRLVEITLDAVDANTYK
jgi:hypothetical protein